MSSLCYLQLSFSVDISLLRASLFSQSHELRQGGSWGNHHGFIPEAPGTKWHKEGRGKKNALSTDLSWKVFFCLKVKDHFSLYFQQSPWCLMLASPAFIVVLPVIWVIYVISYLTWEREENALIPDNIRVDAETINTKWNRPSGIQNILYL